MKKRAEYSYNGLGQRIGQSIYNNETPVNMAEPISKLPQNPEQRFRYVLDVTKQYNNLMMSEDDMEKTEQTFFWDANVAVMEEGGRNSYYLQDDLGSPMQLVDEAGEIREAYGFDEFGLSLKEGTERQMQPFGFTGYQMGFLALFTELCICLEKKLEDDYINIRYVAAYVALIEDT